MFVPIEKGLRHLLHTVCPEDGTQSNVLSRTVMHIRVGRLPGLLSGSPVIAVEAISNHA